jgi:hypothetical protein
MKRARISMALIDESTRLVAAQSGAELLAFELA